MKQENNPGFNESSSLKNAPDQAKLNRVAGVLATAMMHDNGTTYTEYQPNQTMYKHPSGVILRDNQFQGAERPLDPRRIDVLLPNAKHHFTAIDENSTDGRMHTRYPSKDEVDELTRLFVANGKRYSDTAESKK